MKAELVRLFRRFSLAILLLLSGVLAVLTGCQGKLIYFPHPYGHDHVIRWDAEPGTSRMALFSVSRSWYLFCV
jgi:hypothetical protein